jgi:type IV secretion system protein VirB1
MIDLLFITMCSVPSVSSRTLWEIIKVESAFNDTAININTPGIKIPKERSLQESIVLSKELILKRASIDIGLMQINSENLRAYNLSVEDAFDPCQNIRVGSQILKANYDRASESLGSGQAALKAALSAYNTGNFRAGFSNGYVGKYYGEKVVLKRTKPSPPVEDNYPYYDAEGTP